MTDEGPRAPVRLRESGVGVTTGGIVLAWTSLVLPPIGSALATLVAAPLWIALNPPFGKAGQIALGITFVGVIAVIEASPLGLGIDHLLLGFIAMALGMFDIVIGLTVSRWRRES